MLRANCAAPEIRGVILESLPQNRDPGTPNMHPLDWNGSQEMNPEVPLDRRGARALPTFLTEIVSQGGG